MNVRVRIGQHRLCRAGIAATRGEVLSVAQALLRVGVSGEEVAALEGLVTIEAKDGRVNSMTIPPKLVERVELADRTVSTTEISSRVLFFMK